MLTFGAITAPVAPEEFLARYWGRRGVLLRQPQRTFGDQFGWSALNALLNSGDLTAPSTVASFEERVIPAAEFTTGGNGKNIDPAALLKLFREGASFSIRGADAQWAPLKSIIACLYDTFFESIHTNIYCSPANTQGFRCHYDLHEVFVLQVEGEKRWRVFEPTAEFPVEPWSMDDVPDESATKPYIDTVIGKGDVLYVPRGHWHYATAQDSHSLHITVGVTCRKGDVLLDLLGAQLRAEHPVWRRNVPLQGASTATGQLPDAPEFDAWVDELRTTLRDALDDPSLSRRLATELFTSPAPITSVQMPNDGDAGGLPVGRLVFSRPAGQRHVITCDEQNVTVKVAGTELTLEDVSRDLMARVFSPEPFTLRDLDSVRGTVSDGDLSEVLETLVRSGLLIARPA